MPMGARCWSLVAVSPAAATARGEAHGQGTPCAAWRCQPGRSPSHASSVAEPSTNQQRHHQETPLSVCRHPVVVIAQDLGTSCDGQCWGNTLLLCPWPQRHCCRVGVGGRHSRAADVAAVRAHKAVGACPVATWLQACTTAVHEGTACSAAATLGMCGGVHRV
jgi:hypothetical protein